MYLVARGSYPNSLTIENITGKDTTTLLTVLIDFYFILDFFYVVIKYSQI